MWLWLGLPGLFFLIWLWRACPPTRLVICKNPDCWITVYGSQIEVAQLDFRRGVFQWALRAERANRHSGVDGSHPVFDMQSLTIRGSHGPVALAYLTMRRWLPVAAYGGLWPCLAWGWSVWRRRRGPAAAVEGADE